MKIFGNNRNWYKTVFQSSVILFLAYMGIRIWVNKTYVADFEAYCPFGGIQALGSYLTRDSLACSMNSNQIMMGVVLILGVILLSKLFCGYICPLGTISEWLGKLGEKFKIRFTVTGISDKILRLLKYVLLFTVFYFTLQSSELFCKKVDPYYAVTSGFNSDVVVLYSTIAILLLVLGSIFLRMFWCKYLCPLGAASNLFRFWWWIGGVLIVYVVLLRMGLDISYVVPLAVITAGGYILEVWKKEKVQPLFVKVTRNADSCIDCGLCSKKCPQGIDVASMESVAHVDCTLCGDCIAACPEDNTLQINKKNMRWLPALALVVLITAGFILGKTWEVPTIDIQWGTQEQISSAGIYSQTGLKNIKCYGSATAFANQIRNLNGIYGVAAYAGSHSVKIYYDERVWNEDKIKQRLFTPVKRVIEPIALEVDSVKRITITVDHFFDPLDVYYLQQLLLQESDACGFETEYACPVIVHLYFPKGKEPSNEQVKSIIETRELSYTSNGKESNVELNYKLVSIVGQRSLTRVEYAKVMYSKLAMRFNKFSSFSGEVLKQCIVPMQQNSKLRNQYTYLVSHLSNDIGVVGFETWLNEQGEEMGKVIFVDTITSMYNIDLALHVDSLTITKRSGETSRVLNSFKFNRPEGLGSYTEEVVRE